MKNINTTLQSLHQPWFKRWFNSAYYYKLYANRNEKEAQDFIDELIAELQPRPGSKIIDVGCGAGRHCKYLATKGFNVTGIDTALSGIQRAKKSEGESLRFFQHDMRYPFGKNTYDYVFNFFTSFGYFKTRQEHNRVIENMSGALKSTGTVVIDYLNVRYAEDHLVASEEKDIDGVKYHLTRWTDEGHLYKKIVIEDIQQGEPFEYIEQVAKFTVTAFDRMLNLNALQIEAVYGDYELNEYDAEKSPRLIVIAKKA